MSEMLMKGLSSTKRELEAGVADAEAELARTEEDCPKLQELIAGGKGPRHAGGPSPLPQLTQQNAAVSVPPDADPAKARKERPGRADACPPDSGRSLRAH